MKVSGQHTVAVPRQRLWEAFHDPSVLARAVPGCTRLERTGPGRYAATVSTPLTSVAGTYHGDLEVVDRQAPSSVTLALSVAGTPGTVRGSAHVRLEEDGGTTVLDYDAEVEVAGPVKTVGGRLLTSVAQRSAAEVLAGLERELVGVGSGAVAAASAPAVGTTVEPSAPRALVPVAVDEVATSRGRTVGLALLAGAALGLAGVLIGRRWRR